MKGFSRMLYMHLTHKPKPLPASLDLSGQTALVTGANGGLGLEVTKDLAGRKISRIIICARSTQNESDVRETLRRINADCRVDFWTVDYENWQSLVALGRKASENLERLDIAILNAGVRQLQFQKTATGHEQNLQVNHLGTSLLSLLLLPVLERTAKEKGKPTRLTIVASVVHWWTPFHEFKAPSILARMDDAESMEVGTPHDRYGTSKLLNILWTRQLASKASSKLTVINAVDPGLCKSKLHRYENRLPIHVVSGIFSWTGEQGGYNISNAAVVQGTESHGGYVCSEQCLREPSDFVVSKEGTEAQERIWKETVELFAREVEGFSMPSLGSIEE